MYNGIGLPTARGSGTNGHIQKNLSHIRKKPQKYKEYQSSKRDSGSSSKSSRAGFMKAPNSEILNHDRKRQVEIKCIKLREMLKNKGSMDEKEIDLQVNRLKNDLLKDLDRVSVPEKLEETHHLSDAKIKENKKMANALGVKQSNEVDEPIVEDGEASDSNSEYDSDERRYRRERPRRR